MIIFKKICFAQSNLHLIVETGTTLWTPVESNLVLKNFHHFCLGVMQFHFSFVICCPIFFGIF